MYISFFAGNVPKYGSNERGKLLLLLAAMVTAIAILAYARFNASINVRLVGTGLAAALVLAVLPWVIPEISLNSKAPVAFLEKAYAEAPDDVVVVTHGSLLRAASWAVKRHDLFVIDDGGETRYGLSAPDAAGRFLSGDDFSRLLASGSSVLLLCKRNCSDDTRARLPAGVKTPAYGSFSSYLVIGQNAADASRSDGANER